MKIVIKNPAPLGEYLKKWGDYHFGVALEKALSNKGVRVEQHFWPDWDVGVGEDVVLVLRGKRGWCPPVDRCGRQYLMWVLSHPADLTIAECDAYDRIYSASETHQRLLSAVTSTPVGLMRQCTDTEHFFPPERSPEQDANCRDELICVGNSRNVRRELVQWAIDIDQSPVIFGREWERFGLKSYVRSKWIENEELPALYRKSRLCLNDHWDDMRAFGMINNRIFDALACGLPVISDYFPELEEVVGDAVMYARDTGELRQCLERADSDYASLLEHVGQRWQDLKGEFNFARRAEQLLEDLDNPFKKRKRRKVISVPMKWLQSMEQGLREESNHKQVIRQDHESRHSMLREVVDEHRSKLRKLERELDRAREEVGTLRTEARQRSEELEKAQGRTEKLEEALGLEKRRAVVAEKEKVRLKEKLDRDREEVSALRIEAEHRSTELARVRGRTEKLEEALGLEKSRRESTKRQLEHSIAEHKRKRSMLKGRLDQRRDENERLKVRLTVDRRELRKSQQDVAVLRNEVEKMLNSRSWKSTAPIRWLGALARGRRPRPSSAEMVLHKLLEEKNRPPHTSRLGLNIKQGVEGKESTSDGKRIQPQKGSVKKPSKISRKRTGGGKVPYSVCKLEAKLWGGYVKGALSELEAHLDGEGAKLLERVWSAWALARWYHYGGQYDRSLSLARQMAWLDGRRQHDKRRVLIEAEALTALGRCDEAVEELNKALEVVPGEPDLTLALASALHGCKSSASDADFERLAVINRLFGGAGLAPIGRTNPKVTLSLNNLNADVQILPDELADCKVSIIMPVFNAESSIEMAVSSLLAQTWSNLEILAIDDCSEDDTLSILERLAAHDERLQVSRQPVNAGAYAARNAGLAIASGDFITTHDSDDWSHPQKIERQCLALKEDPLAQASVSFWCRATQELRFHGTERPSGKYLQWNHSSLLVRKQAVKSLGCWDNVRVGADTELVHRLRRLYGEDSIIEVDRGVPLSFALAECTSLTRAKETSAITLYNGLRREYREAWAHWHASVRSEQELCLSIESTERPFPAPRLNLPGPRSESVYDLLFVMDWNLGGGAYASSLNYVLAARSHGIKVAVWHRRRPDLDLAKPLKYQIRDLAAAGEVDVISSGDSLRAKYVLIGYPPIYRETIENAPAIESGVIGVIVNQMADRLYSEGDPQYDPQDIIRNIRAEYGQAPTWLPISDHVRELVRKDSRYEGEVSPLNWTPLINLEADPVQPRTPGRGEPVIGRHSRDHYTKWPTRRSDLRQAYCAEKPCRVEIMGGADIPRKLLGKLPSNWNVHAFNSMPTDRFLSQLDFFVHFPNEDYIEEFGRSIIEAMNLNVVCILAPRFRNTFGEAAIYADPQNVWNVVRHLWSNSHRYKRQVCIARKFIREYAKYSCLTERLASLVPGKRETS